MNAHLYRLYSQWDNEKLVKEQSLPENYSEEALLVMKLLIQERGLEKEVQAIEASQQAETEQAFQALTEEHNAKGKAYEYQVLGTNESSAEYAQKQKDADGIFYETLLAKKSGNAALSVLFFVLGTFALIAGGILFFTHPFKHEPLGVYLALGGILSFIFTIYYYKKGRAHFRIIEKGKSVYLEIEERGGKSYKIKYPFPTLSFLRQQIL